MFNKYILFVFFLIAFTNQSNSQSLNNLQEINKVWEKFYEAFDSLDYKPMAEIHSKQVMRITGNKIRDYKTYINNYKAMYKEAKENGVSYTISLRFFERINNDSVASERGVYKLTRKVKGKNEQFYYGQFHVLFKKENGVWKILMDYDSNEENSIGEKEYAKAFGINEIDKFIQN